MHNYKKLAQRKKSIKPMNILKITLIFYLSIIMMTPSVLILNTRSDPVDPWWDLAWHYRKEINIDHTKVDANLVNFPILINLVSDTNLANHAQSTGNDIVFTDINGNKLNHEIELYQSTTGHLVAWVNVPNLSSTTNTRLYVYYGNNLCNNQQNPQGTWNSDYIMVQHMNETNTVYDSTSNQLSGTNTGTTLSSTGIIDGCHNYDSTTDLYNFGSTTTLDPGLNSWTITLWTKVTFLNNHLMLIKWKSNNGYYIKLFDGWGGKQYFRVEDGTHTAYRYWTTNWADNNWHLITMVINRNTQLIDLYLDGTLNNGGGPSSITSFTSINPLSSLQLYGSSTGTQDEFTISKTVRNNSWIKTSYNNQNNPSSFYSISNEEAAILPNQPPIISEENPANNSVNVNINCPIVNITIEDPEGDLFNWTITTSPDIGTNSETYSSNGTKTCSISDLSYSTTYTWTVKANDGNQWTNITYTFTAQEPPINNPPVITNPNPANNSSGVSINLSSLNITIQDPEGDHFIWTIKGQYIITATQTDDTNGTKVANLMTPLPPNTKITWYVNATDISGSNKWTNSTFSFTTKSTPSSWWNQDWIYRKEINIDHTKVDANLVNFPILINLVSDTNLANHAQSTGNDIVFTDINGNKLNHEIELYQSTTGHLVAWVNVPNLSSTTNTRLYVYYGNNLCNNQQNPQGTWNSDYIMVQHMNETNTVYDSTSNQLSGTNTGTTLSSTGIIDGCHNYDSTTDLYNFGSTTTLDPGLNSWTITLWTKVTFLNNHLMLIKWKSNNGYYIKLFDGWGGKQYFRVEDGTHTAYRYWTTNWADNNWHLITMVINRNTQLIDLYLDGTLNNGGGPSSITSFTSINPLSSLQLYGSSTGTQDEFTISKTVRNNSWIKTSYNNQNNPSSFYSISNEEAAILPNQPPIISEENPANNSVNISILQSTVSVKIIDVNGDLINWTIEGKYIKAAGVNYDNNGVESTIIKTPLPYNTKIIWYVNATDPYGNGNVTHRIFSFTTKSFQLPTLKWAKYVPVNRKVVAPLAVDINNDGVMDIIRSGEKGLIALNGATGSEIWRNLYNMYDDHCAMEILDINKDGILEILACGDNGGLSAFSANNGTLLWNNPDAYTNSKYLVAGDINADGYAEIFVCTSRIGYAGLLTAVDYKGKIYAQTNTGYPCWGGLSLADANRDGIFELYQGDYSAYGPQSWSPYDLSHNWNQRMGGLLSGESHCPALVDVNKDGNLEVVAMDQYKGTSSGIAVLDSVTGNPIQIPNRYNLLNWSGGDFDLGNTVKYDVYFGTTSSPPKVSSNQSTTTYNMGSLEYSKTYYWKIVSWDNNGAKTTGPLWSFTTHSYGNNNPYTPSILFPADQSNIISINTALGWTGGDPDQGEPVTYDVYFGTTSTPSKVSGNQTNTAYNPGTLNYNTQYYWKIVAWDSHLAKTTGPLWSFTTQLSSNNPPYKPRNILPANQSTTISVNTELIWNGGDFEGDTVTYDVCFGTTSSPPKVLNNQSTTTYNPGTLSYNIKYYWKIIAWDNNGAKTTGPLWSFTTQLSSNNPPYKPNNPQPGNAATKININRAWYADIPGFWGHSQPTIYDIDNDGNLELISAGYGTGHGTLRQPCIWDLYEWHCESGGVLDNFGRFPYECEDPPSVADIDGDGNVEILCSNPTNITIYSSHYQFLGTLPYANADPYMITQDVDNDTLLELILNVGQNIYVYDLPTLAPIPRMRTESTFYGQNKANSPSYQPYGKFSPVVQNENPSKGIVNQFLNPKLSIDIYQYQHNPMNVIFKTNASTGLWHEIVSYSNVLNGIYSAFPTDMTQKNTKYWWIVCCQDIVSGKWENKTYYFTTQGSMSSAIWWNYNWEYRKEIVIDYLKVAGNLHNFSVLINITVDNDLVSHAQPDGDDIVFTDKNGVKLNHEIELYDHNNGHLIAWVNVTNLSSVNNTVVYLYYGNSTCSNQQNIQGTWNSDYIMVQHMNETNTVYDSTSNQLSGTNTGTTLSSTGIIDGCHNYDSTTDLYNFGSTTTLDPGLNSWTITLWTKVTFLNNHLMLIKWKSNNGYYIKLFDGWGGKQYFRVEDGTHTAYRYWTTNWADNNWHLITMVINRNTQLIDLYLDGTLNNGGGPSSITSFTSINPLSSLQLYGSSTGTQDEFTISKTVRNNSWIKTCYNNQRNPSTFYIIWEEELKPAFDTESPIINNISINPDVQEEGKYVLIKCNVTDDSSLYDVRVDISGSNGYQQNVSIINNNNENTYYYNSPYLSGNYSFFICAEDNAASIFPGTTNNINISGIYYFNITPIVDLEPPQIFDVISSPASQEQGNNINITCNVMDNLNVDIVNAIISYPDSTIFNYSMIHIPSSTVISFKYYLNQTYTMLGTYTYYIWVKDISNNQNISLTYTFTVTTIQYTLTVNTIGTGTVTKSPDDPSYDPGTEVTLEAIPEFSWAFDYWSGDLTGYTNPITITMNEDKLITTHFIQNPATYILTINIDPEGAGTVTASPDPPYPYHVWVTLIAIANPGYTFSHWSGDYTGTENPIMIMMGPDRTLTAHFTSN